MDEFLGTMGIMAASLQFDCSDCHVNAGTANVDWAADTPTEDDGAPDGEHGRRHQPDQLRWTPAGDVLDLPSQSRQAARHADPGDDLRHPDRSSRTTSSRQFPGADLPQSILDRYIQASGGAQRLAGLTSISAKGIAVGFGGFGGDGDG